MKRNLTKKSIMALIVALAVISVTACSTGTSNGTSGTAGSTAAKSYALTAAGSSFINPLFTKMFSEYNKLHPEITVNYQSIGSGGGIQQLTAGTIDFAATDAYMSDTEIAAVGNGVIELPVSAGAVAIIYNVTGVEKGLKLTQETLTNIFLGKIIKWNDAAIQADNAGITLPDVTITPVYRSDSSGTTAIFTDYLSTVSTDWKSAVGSGKSVKFPVGVGGKGNDGIAGQVKQIPGSIGYVELAYATTNSITYAQLRNKDGKFVYPSVEAATLAAETAAVGMPADTRVSIVEKPGADSYGIVGLVWAVVYAKYDDPGKRDAIVALMKWIYRDAQQYSNALTYAKIPESIAKINDANLAKIK